MCFFRLRTVLIFRPDRFGGLMPRSVMEKIGGGGHLTMAGAQLSGETMEQARRKLLDAIDEFSRERGVLTVSKAEDSAGL